MGNGNVWSLPEIQDTYPSRGCQKAKTILRQDPVVYAQSYIGAPIDQTWIKRYERQGFLILEDVFSNDEVAHFQAEAKRLRCDKSLSLSETVITEPESGDIRSIFKVHDSNPIFSKLACDTRLAGLASYLLNDTVYIHQSRLNYKPGFRGKEFYWHSDFETWHVEDGMSRMRALSISLTLSENHIHNGPLMLIPGSHKHYVVCEGQTPAEHYKSSLKKQEYGVPKDNILESLVREGGITVATGKPGSIIVFDCNTMHGSNGNITPYPRSNLFFVYNAMDNRVVEPFCRQRPRPEYICTRRHIRPISL